MIGQNYTRGFATDDFMIIVLKRYIKMSNVHCKSSILVVKILF